MQRWHWSAAIILVLGSMGGLPSASTATLAPAPSLNQQLNIRLYNGTGGATRDRADQLLRLGGQEEEWGNLDKAIAYWFSALELYHQIGDLTAVGLTYDYIGLTYGSLGQYPEAEDALRRRLAVARDNQDFRGQVYGLNNTGTVLLQRGAMVAARDSFEEALTIARSIRSLEGQGLSWSNLGLVAAGLGDYAQAIQRYETALIFRRQVADARGEANTLNNLGDAYRSLRKSSEALGAYGAALRLARQNRDRPNQFRALDGLIAVYRTQSERAPRLRDLLEERLTLAQDQQHLRQQLVSLQGLGELYQTAGNPRAARSFYERAVEIARSLHDVRTEAALLDQLQRLNTLSSTSPR